MSRLEIEQPRPVYLGAVLIVGGILLKRLIELALTADGRIEHVTYLTMIYGAQVVAVASGAYLLVKRPAIRLPGKGDILLLTFSLLGTLTMMEVGARVWLNYMATPEQQDRYVLFTAVPPQQRAWTPHHYLSYSPTPNYRKGGTSHNSLGYRNDEFPLQKPDGVFRIVALGGSTTYDVSIENNEETFTAQLERLLREEYGYDQVQVINAGVPGYNSWEMLVNLEFRVLDLEPDLVILYEGTNDVHARMVQPSAYRGDNSGRRQLWQAPQVALWEHSALLRILSRRTNYSRQVSVDDFVSAPTYLSWPFESRLQEMNADPAEILRENPPVYYQRNLENMIAVARAHDVGVLLATWAHSPELNDYASLPYYQEGFAENNRVVEEVAASQDVPLYDYASEMPQERQYWADGRHVNEEGALLKAELFAEFINREGLISR